MSVDFRDGLRVSVGRKCESSLKSGKRTPTSGRGYPAAPRNYGWNVFNCDHRNRGVAADAEVFSPVFRLNGNSKKLGDFERELRHQNSDRPRRDLWCNIHWLIYGIGDSTCEILHGATLSILTICSLTLASKSLDSASLIGVEESSGDNLAV
jgi:hypothetical protein